MLSGKESEVLLYLREDARKSLAEISGESGIPVATVHGIVRRLKKRGIIIKYASLMDFQRIGYSLRVMMAIKTDRKAEVMRHLSRHPNVNSLSKAASGCDFCIDAVFRHCGELELFKEGLQKFNITYIGEHNMVEEIKAESSV